MTPYNELNGKQKLVRTLIVLPFAIFAIWVLYMFVVKPKSYILIAVIVIVWVWQLAGNIIDIVNGR